MIGNFDLYHRLCYIIGNERIVSLFNEYSLLTININGVLIYINHTGKFPCRFMKPNMTFGVTTLRKQSELSSNQIAKRHLLI